MGTRSHKASSVVAVALAFALAAGTTLLWASAAGMQKKIAAKLSGSEQVPPVQTKGSGQFQGTITGEKSISYQLKYSGLSSRVTAAHIHTGMRKTNGPIVVFFCGGGGRPSCPASGGTVTGTISAASVVAGGNIKRGDLAEVIRAITSGNAYVNVHTTKYPGGEIRGQIEASK